MIKRGFLRIGTFSSQLADNWFVESDAWIARWLSGIWLTALFVIGLGTWSIFYNWGDLPLDMADWGDITVPRLIALTDAINQGELPLHVSGADLIKGVTDRYLTIPDLILSPQVLLLRFLDPGLFVYFNLLLLYTAGFAGLLLFRKRFRIGLAVFSILFLLFNFNGHIVAHLAIGHATWMSYFLLPYFILLIFELLENKNRRDWILKMVILQVVILLQGGYHFFVWILFFLTLLGIFTPGVRRTAFLTCLFSVTAAAFRILPAGLLSSSYKLSFLGGFTTLNEVVRGLVSLVEPAEAVRVFSPLNPYVGWWEFDYYIGWAGVVLITGALFFSWKKQIQLLPVLKPLVIPGLILSILSIGRLYKPFFMLQIPLLNGERVASRFLILPLLLLMFAAAVLGQRLIQETRLVPYQRVLFFGLFFILFSDLLQHAELWNVQQLEELLLPVSLDPSLFQISNRIDPVYTGSLAAGAAISLITLAGLAYVRYQKNRKQEPPAVEVI